jgi:hypothetical protein
VISVRPTVDQYRGDGVLPRNERRVQGSYASPRHRRGHAPFVTIYVAVKFTGTQAGRWQY